MKDIIRIISEEMFSNYLQMLLPLLWDMIFKLSMFLVIMILITIAYFLAIKPSKENE